MDLGEWYLKPISDFFFLLDRRSNNGIKNILTKRFKKNEDAIGNLLSLIGEIDSLGYEDGLDFAFKTERIKTIKNQKLSLIEIRKFYEKWRIITYFDKDNKRFIMIDAFNAHNGKDLDKKVKEIKDQINIAVELSNKEAM